MQNVENKTVFIYAVFPCPIEILKLSTSWKVPMSSYILLSEKIFQVVDNSHKYLNFRLLFSGIHDCYPPSKWRRWQKTKI